MAILPPIEASTVTAIYAAREAARENFDSIGISMSDLGSECDRAIWYSFRWASEAEYIDGQKDSRFETGNKWEERLIEDVRRIPGVTLSTIDPETGRQWKVYSHGGHVRGKLDGDELLGLPEAPKTIHVLECKSHNEKSFKEVVKKGLKAAKPNHWLQCQKYMELRGRLRCLYLMVNKNTDERWSERIEYDPAAVLQLNVRLERIINQPKAPGRIADNASKYPCILCRHKDVCHGDAFGRDHCRTCVHATPIVDHEDTAAPWLCEKYNKILTVDEQRAGCHAHLFLPDVVPGEQTDAGDDWVAYRMRDGSTWIDQEKKPSEEPPAAGCEVCGGSNIEMIDVGHGTVIEAPCGACRAVATRYWHHPESGSVFTTENGEHPGSDGLVEELTAAEFAEASAYYASLKVTTNE